MAKSMNKMKMSGMELWTLRSWSSPSFLSKDSKIWGSLVERSSSPCQLWSQCLTALWLWRIAAPYELRELGHTSRPFSRDLLLCWFVCWLTEHLHFQNLSLFDHTTFVRYHQQPSYLKPGKYLSSFTSWRSQKADRKEERKDRQAGMRAKPCPWSLWRALAESSRSRWAQTSSGCPPAQKEGADSSSHSSPLANLPLLLRQEVKA